LSLLKETVRSAKKERGRSGHGVGGLGLDFGSDQAASSWWERRERAELADRFLRNLHLGPTCLRMGWVALARPAVPEAIEGIPDSYRGEINV
jgi:hypothetical protein